ncbi:hydride transferase [Rhodococcus ruber BKS 20-38]|uniref:Hydride transferase n=2 Tax=Rhodococcus ruber TaxID=1830 RepID=M2ZA58_9NOCA|nr:hydride transferase [Rhodococcus ruber BKS 20-38]
MLAAIRREAERAGRDAGAVDVVLRVDASPGTNPSLIIDTLEEVEQLTGINHAFVELLLLAQDVTEAIDVATTLLYMADKGAHTQ